MLLYYYSNGPNTLPLTLNGYNLNIQVTDNTGKMKGQGDE